MYTKTIPYKDFLGKPHNGVVQFNLTEREVLKLMVELHAIDEWIKRMESSEARTLEPEEVRDYYTNFEEILLAAWGELSEDGQYFRKSGRYDFEESALFAATMNYYLMNPEETGELLEGIMPKGMKDLVEKTEGNLAKMEARDDVSDELKREIARLKSQLEGQNKD